MNFSEAVFYEHYLTSDFHTHCYFKTCLPTRQSGVENRDKAYSPLPVAGLAQSNCELVQFNLYRRGPISTEAGNISLLKIREWQRRKGETTRKRHERTNPASRSVCTDVRGFCASKEEGTAWEPGQRTSFAGVFYQSHRNPVAGAFN